MNRYVANFIGEMNFIELADKTLAVRPECVIIRPGGSEGIAGIVRTIMVLGHYIEVTVSTEYGIIKAFVSAESAEAFQPGEKVSLSFLKVHEFAKEQSAS